MANDISGGTANLEPLTFIGGTTPVHVPGPGSDAIDNGPLACTSPDQVGEPRPRNGVCDIGAIEIVPPVDVCFSQWTKLLYAPIGGECNTPHYRGVIFEENGPHYLCANPYTGILSYGTGPVCQPLNRPAIVMPDAAPLDVCLNRATKQYRLPRSAMGCAATEIATTLS